MKLFNKSTLAIALGATLVAAPAVSADLDFNADNTVVLADVIFGNGKPGTGSEETLITHPQVRFDLVDAAGNNNGDSIVQQGVATIKFTLGGGAVFGEDLSTTALATPYVAVNGAANVAATVVQGGAIGDNTITFELTEGDVGADFVTSVDFGGFRVKNLTSALNPDSSSKKVELGVEYVEGADDVADDVDVTATDLPLVVFGSQAPIDLTANPVDFQAAPFTRINVGGGELQFTGGTLDGRSDFDPAGDVNLISLGTLQLSRNAINLTTFPNAPTAGPGVGELIKKENGDDFDFQGGDTHALTFSVGSGEMQVGSTVYLHTNADCTSGTTLTGSTTAITTLAGNQTVFGMTVVGNTTELTTPYHVCYQTDVVAPIAAIPEVGQISVTWDVDFFNARYDNISEAAGNFGDLLRNGCIASFFNVPAVGNADTAYIRLTNTSTTNEGDIRGTLYAQDGTILGQDVTIAPDLAVSATQVFSTEGADRTTAAGQNIIDIETAFGVTGSTDYKGRARLVLKGAFDTCEGLGLIRTGEGSLFNMTATTQGNEAGGANDGNNGN